MARIQLVFAVKDVVAEVFHNPFFAPNTASAVRMFSDAIADPNSPPSKHPKDFELHQLGSFDDEAGTLHGFDKPERLVRGQDLASVGSAS